LGGPDRSGNEKENWDKAFLLTLRNLVEAAPTTVRVTACFAVVLGPAQQLKEISEGQHENYEQCRTADHEDGNTFNRHFRFRGSVGVREEVIRVHQVEHRLQSLQNRRCRH
jgi:hypothetical protein